MNSKNGVINIAMNGRKCNLQYGRISIRIIRNNNKNKLLFLNMFFKCEYGKFGGFYDFLIQIDRTNE